MDFLCSFPAAYPPSPSSYTSTPLPPIAAAAASSSIAAATSTAGDAASSGTRAGSEGGRSGSTVGEMAGAFISGLLTCVFAIVGLFVGAVTGAFIGLATESGLFRGAGIGAISGAVFSIDVVESSLVTRGSGIWSILCVVDVVTNLLNGRLVQEEVGPVVQNAVQRQMSAIDVPFREVIDIFETGGTKGMARASVDRIPRVRITVENRVDASGEQLCCSVCLQDLQPGETARCLPYCRHMFHVPCIDGWLIRHGSCPLCRRDF